LQRAQDCLRDEFAQVLNDPEFSKRGDELALDNLFDTTILVLTTLICTVLEKCSIND
jgi:hypothetical protein